MSRFRPLHALIVSAAALAAAVGGCGDSDHSGAPTKPSGGKGGKGGSAGSNAVGGEGGEGDAASGGRGGKGGGKGGTSGRGGRGGSGATGEEAGTGGSAAEGGAGEDPCDACSDQHRECDLATGTCGDCFEDFREDGDSCVCPPGQIPEGNGCVACADDFTPSCQAAGETGNVVRKVDGVCICETEDGYFFNLESNTAQACDGDEDGWVNDGAQPALDGEDEVLRENARCGLRRVFSFLLENETGDTFESRLIDDFPDGLPLYESARNDGVESATPHAPYGAESLRPEVLNSLTKACVTPNGDYDDNGIPDLGEWSGRTLAGRVTRNPRLQGYYQRYLRFAHYLELHDGWFEEDEDGDRYHLAERSRVGAGVPVRYPSGSNSYARQCERHVDVDYMGRPESYAGGDFVEIARAWGGMTHHSQFKCVQVMSENDYGSAYSRERNPEIVYKPLQAGFARRATAGTLHQCPSDVTVSAPVAELYDWSPNTCSARTTTSSRSGVDAPNPALAEIDCTPADPATIEPGVYWMAVGFENYACERSDAVTERPNDYTRGCVNACAEHGVEACPEFDPNDPGGATRFTCDDEGRSAFGRLQCGCGQNYGGASCEIGCTNDELFKSPNFSIETRDGYWLCSGAQASSGPLLTGPNLSLFGYVPSNPSGAAVLSAGPYELRGR